MAERKGVSLFINFSLMMWKSLDSLGFHFSLSLSPFLCSLDRLFHLWDLSRDNYNLLHPHTARCAPDHRRCRTAQNKYYPPDWTPAQGSLNRMLNQHPLRSQGNTYAKVAMGLMTIRFETPWGAFPVSSRQSLSFVPTTVNSHPPIFHRFIFDPLFSRTFFGMHRRADFWCDGCKNHVAKGVRFNAEKKAIGAYFTTKIWQFSMTCHRCSHPLVFVTEPQVCGQRRGGLIKAKAIANDCNHNHSFSTRRMRS